MASLKDVQDVAARARHIFEYIEGYNLRESEEEWLERLEKALDRQGVLSERQMEVLEEIYREACSR